MKRRNRLADRSVLSLVLCMVMLFAMAPTAMAGTVEIDNTIPMVYVKELPEEWKKDQEYTLADPAPWNLEEIKQVVDVQDPRSVAAYWVWAVNRLVSDYDDGMEMMKYLFADIEPYGPGFTEGGMSGKAGWDSYFNERLKDANYSWLPRAYFEGAAAGNGFAPERPLRLELYYNNTNTETINAQTLESFGRLNIVYWVKSYAGGHQVNITVSKFDGSDRWYVTSGTTSSALFYDQRSALEDGELDKARSTIHDSSTEAEHRAHYGGVQQAKLPFTDVKDSDYFADAVAWAYHNQVTTGTSATTFGPKDSCTRGQVVTFLWRAAGKPAPKSGNNPFTDVKQGDYFYDAVLWAVEQGITGGTSATTFSPGQTCSSAHIITFLYRAQGGDNGWYEVARDWAKDATLLDGTEITVNPNELCPRGDVITFLYRVYQ